MTVGEYFRSNLILFGALCAGQVIFALVASMPNVAQTTPELFEIFRWFVPVFGVAVIAIFQFLAKKRYANATGDLGEKAQAYRATLITVLAAHEGATFFAIVTYMNTSEPLLLGYALVFFISMLPNAPLKSHFIRKLSLNKEELSIVNDDTAKLFP